MWGRMLDAGVRFSFLDRVVAASPLRPGQDLQGQGAAERARREYEAARDGPG